MTTSPWAMQAAIDEKIDRLLDAAVEFDDRAGAKFEDVLEQHLAGSKAQGDAEFDIQKKIEIAIAGLGGDGARGADGRRRGLGCRDLGAGWAAGWASAARRVGRGSAAGSGGVALRSEAQDVEFEIEASLPPSTRKSWRRPEFDSLGRDRARRDEA